MTDAPRPILIVAGLGRCGSSLTMQMLDAGGAPCFGSFPDYEEQGRAPHGRALEFAWLAECIAGHAIKVLDPHLTSLPRTYPGPAIWLDRDPAEQVRSQAKLAVATLGIAPPDRNQRRRWERTLIAERRRALAALEGREILHMRFETLIERPAVAVHEIASFAEALWIARVLDRAAMAAQVCRRDAACAPGLDLEAALISQAEARP